MTLSTHDWKGQSGKFYEYHVYDMATVWNPVPGNYIFAHWNGYTWVADYIGQTDSLKDRLPNHNERGCAIRSGATHIHAHANQSKTQRLAEEIDLIKLHKPKCNQQYNAA